MEGQRTTSHHFISKFSHILPLKYVYDKARCVLTEMVHLYVSQIASESYMGLAIFALGPPGYLKTGLQNSM